jgi:hypothetical protein
LFAGGEQRNTVENVLFIAGGDKRNAVKNELLQVVRKETLLKMYCCRW